MKFHQLLIVAAIFLTACSPQKYVYHFDKYDYNVGKKTAVPNRTAEMAESPLIINDEALTVSAESKPTLISDTHETVTDEKLKSLSRKVNAMSKTERKEFKKELKKELKGLIRKR